MENSDYSYSLQMENITIIRNNIKLLDDVSYKLPDSAVTVVTGLLGSGRSIFLKALASIIVPDRGEVSYNGKKFSDLSPYELKTLRRRSSFVFHDSALWANKSIYQNLELPLLHHFPNFSSKEINNKINKVLDITGFTYSVSLRPSDISAGNRKLISFARALITDPDILFIDGLETSLDFSSLGRIRNIIKELKADNKTIVITTYDNKITATMADYLVLLDKHKIYVAGTYNHVIRSEDSIVKELLSHVIR